MEEKSVVPFIFENNSVRVVLIGDDPWWIATDVCAILGYANSRQALATHLEDDEKGVQNIDTLGGVQNLSVISESGLYTLIVRSNKPQAKQFRKWVTAEVLPAIRKTGGYQVAAALPNFSDPVAAARAWADEVEAKQAALNTIEENRPKVEFFDQVTDSKDAVDMAGAAKVLNMGIGRTKLFAFLRDQKILMANNMPYQEMIDRGYFRVIEQKFMTNDGELRINFKTVVYQRGLAFIRKRYKEVIG